MAGESGGTEKDSLRRTFHQKVSLAGAKYVRRKLIQPLANDGPGNRG
jgi:hypothetical protein